MQLRITEIQISYTFHSRYVASDKKRISWKLHVNMLLLATQYDNMEDSASAAAHPKHTGEEEASPNRNQIITIKR